MRIPRNHPRFAGLRFLHVPEALAASACRNLGFGGGPPASANNASALARGLKGPAFTFAHSSGGVVYGTSGQYGPPGGDVTVIHRFKFPLAPSAGGVHVTAASSPGDTTSLWSFFYVVNGFTNTGINFGVYKSGNFWVRNAFAVDLLGRDVVVAGVHHRAAKSNRVYIDGVQSDTADVTNIDPTTFDFDDVWSGVTNLTVGYDCEADVGFLAVFNRPLSPSELTWWGTEANWLPLLQDDEDWVLSGGVNTSLVRTGVSVVSGGRPAGGVRSAVAMEASLSVGGDLAAEPANSSTSTVRLGLRVASASGPPTLSRSRVAVGVAIASATATPTASAVGVGVRVKSRAYVDGRVDLLGAARYRR